MGIRLRIRRVCLVALYIVISSAIFKTLVTVMYVPDVENVQILGPNNYWKNKTKRLILLWTTFWRTQFWTEVDTLGMPGCARSCDVTTDKSKIAEADAILFHWGDLWWWTQLPVYRRPNQIWAFFNLEPPHKQSNLAKWNNVFNWSISYRQDSTVFVPFGSYSPLSADEKVSTSKERGNRNYAKEKKYNISLTSSNCYDDARRYRLAAEINQYIKVDMFGKCNDKVCVFNTPECDEKLKLYKFQLALENSYCRDYFSEKFWETFEKDVVPIVAWKQSPGNLAPPHSYINIFDFPDIKSFSNYLMKVLQNDELYNSYFKWKLAYKAGCHYNCQWCPICEKLSSPEVPLQVIRDPYRWLRDDTCDPFSVSYSLLCACICRETRLKCFFWLSMRGHSKALSLLDCNTTL